MFEKVLVVCVGNICRSPVGERALQAAVPGLSVGSAGISALVGHAADDMATQVAAANGLSLDGHSARQFTAELGEAHDLILVMEPGHRRDIAGRAPHLSGRMMLFDRWTDNAGIPDPYQRPQEFHEMVFARIDAAARAWAARLGTGGTK